MNCRMLMMFGVIIAVAATSPVAADPRDSVDRGQRLDTDALRDDAATSRLVVPGHPLTILPSHPAPANQKKQKSNVSGRKDY